MDYGLVLDIETTGIDPKKDAIIEIGILEFGVHESGQPPSIVSVYGALEDPGRTLDSEIVKLTGLTDGMLKGQRIAWDYVRSMIERATLVIAHNAAFDRSFIELRPELQGLHSHWACSMKHIDWEKKGFRTRALNYLAADHGFVNPFAHRAIFDCATTFRILQPHFYELLERSQLREIRILAHQAPFDLRDKLKQRRYHWDAQRRVWFKDLLEDGLLGEREFLATEIYQGRGDVHEEIFLGQQGAQELSD